MSHSILTAAGQTWPPFVLVAGLLLIGAVADAEGLYETIGARFACGPLGPSALLVSLLALVAVVTAVLNLDTAVVFLTPVLVHTARRRGLDERPFLYGSVFMANSASLLLPGSNLTNLLVLRAGGRGGITFAATMLLPWLVACALTAGFVLLRYRPAGGASMERERPRVALGVGAAGIVAAAALVVALPNPALPVLAAGVAASAVRRRRPGLDLRVLAALFALSVGLGALARAWEGPARLLASCGAGATAAVGALCSVLVDNLPAAVLLSAHRPAHEHALLLGLDLGPNLAVTGSLSAYLWLRAARAVGADASLVTYSRLGAALVPLTLAGALGALWVSPWW